MTPEEIDQAERDLEQYMPSGESWAPGPVSALRSLVAEAREAGRLRAGHTDALDSLGLVRLTEVLDVMAERDRLREEVERLRAEVASLRRGDGMCPHGWDAGNCDRSDCWASEVPA